MVGAITALAGAEGHQVITAYDGHTAVRRFRDEAPDIVLLDLTMPGGDGFAVGRAIRAAGSAPIIVVSGDGSEGATVRALGGGADDYVVKPFGTAELLARITAVMRWVDSSAGRAVTRIIEAAGLRLDLRRHLAHAGESQLQLTPTEFRLLEALVRARGDIVPHHQLARAGFPAETSQTSPG
jgi:DNA-binding response OmpR family regulator